MYQSKLILVAGPTAAGKSDLAHDLALRKGGTVINADAMQVYAGLPILTNQPSSEEQKEIPHELFAVLDPALRSSAGKWLVLASAAIKKAADTGRTPILAGGTGLYFKALLEGLAEIPAVPDEGRKKAQKLYDEKGEEKFRQELAKLDAVSAARIAKNDRQRLIRAYEVAAYTGKTLHEWQKNEAETKHHSSPILETHLLLPPREELYAACDRRFQQMIKHGAIDEVRAFLKRGLDPSLPAMKIIGVREIGAYLRGTINLDQAIAKAQQATRNYAKRQMTWFRNQWKF